MNKVEGFQRVRILHIKFFTIKYDFKLANTKLYQHMFVLSPSQEDNRNLNTYRNGIIYNQKILSKYAFEKSRKRFYTEQIYYFYAFV